MTSLTISDFSIPAQEEHGSSSAPEPTWSLKQRQVLPTLSVGQQGVYGCYGVGGVVWDSAIVLSHLISTESLPFPSGTGGCCEGSIAGKRVIELGSGTGAVGLAAAACGAESVVLTDQAKTLELTEANLRANSDACRGCAVSIREADWDVAGHVAAASRGCDICLAADCVYEGDWESDLGVSFLGALREAFQGPNGVTYAVVAYKRFRSGQHGISERFLTDAMRAFVVEEVDEAALLPAHQGTGIHVICVRAR
mmetsp:Transcript_60053/g.82238  ORF Transcript_60053/g.82238 Transcript_60053/m.82238 type:complete len:253 (-) Transcript_60053:380-1138(-)|eukprot:CAMPEP_0185773132 /NCGR_PEP_ID=MMETSP1174-20130828/72311_1 /TAXON_ID=35687 /ORGANISM="Dictyocha speculum, Strain CCMP1381" /LENGTH=252 /DNA_ID=CAMNT_0028459687 /DNA_START=77 /DNA_END=835 /DNA_ORIENTATION=+